LAYKLQSIDTSYEAEQVQISILRKRGEAGRGSLMLSLTNTTRSLSWNSLLQSRGEASRFEAALGFIGLNYGDELAHQVRNYLPVLTLSEEKLLNSEQELLAALSPVVEALKELEIQYSIGGSVASSVHGLPRATADADLVADLREEHIAPFIKRLEDNYYLSEIALRQALERHTSFNLIHLETGFKIDIFVLKPDPFDRTSFSRSKNVPLSNSSSRQFRIHTPEDILLQKLRWYRDGNQISDKQWNDILGVLKMQPQLDYDYLEEWATQLGLGDLLSRAREQSGRSAGA
jgi:hypothetical protein